MRHDIRLIGHAFALRPIELDDARLIVELRGDAERTRFLHPVPLDVAMQAEYLERYFEREGDYYFVVERIGGAAKGPEGLVSIYNLEPDAARAEWGRWILRDGSLAAVESAWLIYRVAFECLGLNEVYCLTLSESLEVLSFHDRAGLARMRHLEGVIEIGGRPRDAIEHVLTREQWPEVCAKLERLALGLARRLQA
jgi:RimJ/RimL family protein N-acetyltransferase